MKDYLNEINEKFPIRRTEEQKKGLFEYVKAEAESVGLDARVETLEKKHNNIVIGDVENASVVYTAHYDTPARSLVPNLMMPRNPGLVYLYAFGIPLTLAFASLGVAYGIQALFGLPYSVFVVIYLALYFGAFFGVMRMGANKTNKNDNTSGVATVLSIMANNPKGAAYILFDNEEKGLLGSKALLKSNKEFWENKPLINFDCVGLGDNIVIVAMKNAEKHPTFEKISETVNGNNEYSVGLYPKKGSAGNTDSKNFPCGFSVMACKKSKKGVLYTPYIHTKRDTVASSENIAFLAGAFTCLSNSVCEEAV